MVVVACVSCGANRKISRARDAKRRPKCRSCGNTTHGQHGGRNREWETPAHVSWRNMVTRCTCPKWHNFALYGGRGISVHPDWLGRRGFARFFLYMGARPVGKTLDRIDPDGNYEPGNVRWATKEQQEANKRALAA